MESNSVADQDASSSSSPQTDRSSRSSTPIKMSQSMSSTTSSPSHEPLESVDENYPLSRTNSEEEEHDSIVPVLASPKPTSPVSQRSIFRPPSDRNPAHQSTNTSTPSPLNKSTSSLGQNVGRSTEDPRLALFDDHVASAHVPGSLHLAPDSAIERLVERQGVVPLIRQLASDLAHRDRELVAVRRRAEERERALKKMLVEVEVSNAAIERRLATATLQRKVSRETMRSNGDTISYTENIDEMMQQAMSEEDVFSVVDDAFSERMDENTDWGEDMRGDMGDMSTPKATVRARSDSRSILFERDSDSFSITSDGSSSRRGSKLRGWKDYFWGQKTGRGWEEDFSKIRPALGHQNTAKRRGITTETFSPPPEVDSRSIMSRSSSRASIHSPTKQSRAASLQITSTIRRTASPSSLYTYPHFASDQSHPTPPHFKAVSMSQNEGGDAAENLVQRRTSNTVAAWALRLVSHAPPPDQENQNNPRSPSVSQQRSVSGPVEESSPRSDRRLSSGSVDRENLQRIMAKNSARTQTSPRRRALSTASNGTPAGNSKFFQGFMDHAERIVPLGSSSQSGPAADPSSGPVEMDTIVPHAIQPPTLLQSWNEYYPTDYLTDRFGFIYNKNHRPPSMKDDTLKGPKDEEASQDITPEDEPPTNVHVDKESIVDGGDPKTPTKWQELLIRPPSPSVSSSKISPKASTTTAETSVSAQKAQTKPKPQAITILDKISKSNGPVSSINTTTFSEAPLALRSPMNSEMPSGTEAYTVRLLLGQLSDLHDSLQRDRSMKWNEFFKKIRHERRRGEEEERGMPEVLIGDGELIGIATLGNEGRGGRQRWKEFKSLVLGGIPVAYRWKVWAECSSATALRVPGYYEDILQNGQDDPQVILQIAMDINRTLTDNIFYREGPGVQKLKQVLVAYSRRNPAVGYCQGMNMIAASLLLIMPSEEDAFWVLCSIVEKILPKTYFETSLLASRADQQVLKEYVHEILPTLDSHLLKLGVELEALTFQWFLSIFTDCLAAEALFRVWDVILCLVGSPFLFQVALALLKLNEKALLDCNSAAGVYSYLNGEMTHQGISIDGLIRESDGMRGMVKRVDVERRRERAVKRELADMAVGEEEEAARIEASLFLGAAATTPAPTGPAVAAAVNSGGRVNEAVETNDGARTISILGGGITGENNDMRQVKAIEAAIRDSGDTLNSVSDTSNQTQEPTAATAMNITEAVEEAPETSDEISEGIVPETKPTVVTTEFTSDEKARAGKMEISLSPITEDKQPTPELSPLSSLQSTTTVTATVSIV